MRILACMLTALVVCHPANVPLWASEKNSPVSQVPSGEEITGSVLLRRCEAAVRIADGEDVDASQTVGGLLCIGYIAGFIDGYVLSVSWSARGKKPTLCPPPEGIAAEQGARIVAKWLKENPKYLHGKTRASLLVGLSRAYPCN